MTASVHGHRSGPLPDPCPYDAVPYPLLSHSKTHPNRLAVPATLMGMQPAPVEGCRVLELGCAGGGNLIPMAEGLPDSRFVGIDRSARQIAEGQATVAELGLSNIELRQLDILDVDDRLGRFDYIIAHGVYSWVPVKVRGRILHICRRHLNPNGVAFISYNVYPGWHMMQMMRDMMLYHTRYQDDPTQRAAAARQFVQLLDQVASSEQMPFSSFFPAFRFLIREYTHFVTKDDAALLHDELEAVNDPVYFHQFVEQAAGHGLQYMGDANPATMAPVNLPESVVRALAQMARDPVDAEQYMDFVRNRTFRQSLLCHQEVRLSRRVQPEVLRVFYIASLTKAAAGEAGAADDGVVKFQSKDGAALSTNHPVTVAAMYYLNEIWPQMVLFDELLAQAYCRLDGATPVAAQDLAELSSSADGAATVAQDARLLAINLLKGYTTSDRMVELYLYPPRFVTQISGRPVASPWSRWQVRRSPLVTNARHERIELDPFCQLVLSRLDGSRDREALQRELLHEAAIADVMAQVERASRRAEQADGGSADDAAVDRTVGVDINSAEFREELARNVEKALEVLANTALLIG